MSSQPTAPRVIRFGLFEADLSAGELRKQNRNIKLQYQPFQVLALLLSRPGDVVTREELQRALWPADTFVEFDQGLNTAIKKIRLALGDSADNPRFVETVARRGYRFLAPVAEAAKGAAADQAAHEIQEMTGNVAENRRRWHVLLWAVVGILSLALIAVVRIRQRPTETHAIRFQVPPPERVAQEFVDIPAVSPDGRHVVFSGTDSAGGRHLWLHSLDSLTTELVPEIQADHLPYRPFWSPDSRFVGYFQLDKLKKIDITAGPPSVLCDAPYPVSGGAAWNSDGTILSAPMNGVLRRVSAAGGESTEALGLDKSRKEIAQIWPHFLPDGHHFLYLSQSSDVASSGIYLASLDSKETSRLLSAQSNVAYAPPGFLIYGQLGRLVAQPFSMRGLRITGDPVPIAERVEQTDDPGFAFSASSTGVLVYRTAVSNHTQLVWYGRDGKRLGSAGEPGDYGQIALSPDEKRLAVERLDTGKHTVNVWILELSSGIFSRLTFSNDDGNPVWSPDGREVLFSSQRGDRRGLYRKVIGGSDETLIIDSTQDMWSENWVADGKSIVIIDHAGKAFSQVQLSGDRNPVVLLKSEFYKDEPHVSPDQRWIAYNATESGRWEVYAATFPGFTAKRQVSKNGGAQALWRRDGKELFYLSLDGKLMVVDVKAEATIETGMPHVLFQTRLAVAGNQDQYCVTGDGNRFIFREPVGESTTPITVAVNWDSELKR
jgi:eukaryotic-like serine/threonine-protein kinase